MNHKQGNTLTSCLLRFISENKYAVFVSLFFSIAAYGYFITNWSISIDSEIFSYPENSFWQVVLSQGRFLLIYPFLNYQVIPFWNDFFSVVLIYLASMIIAATISNHLPLPKEKLNTNSLFLIFLLIFNISPIYTFILQFTICNLIVAFGILTNSILFFRITSVINQKAPSIFNKYTLNVLLLTIAMTCYETFVVYYISLALFFIILHVSQQKCVSFKYILNHSSVYLLILIYSLTCYVLMKCVAVIFTPQSGYLNEFIQYGNVPLRTILINLVYYFKRINSYPFNFFYSITIVAGIVLIALTIHQDKHRAKWLVLFLIALYISPFLIILLSGNGLPFRTMPTIPLVASLIWFLIATHLSNKKPLKYLTIFIAVCSLLNAQYINRIFYGDNMRLQYDINFANQIYSHVLNSVGDSIKTKPLVIIGKHPTPSRKFIIKSDLDTMGISFFAWPGNPPYNPQKQGVSSSDRMYFFMSWLGNDYIRPTYEQYNKGLIRSLAIKSYPNKKSLIEYDDMILLKLSAPYIWDDSKPIKFNLTQYQHIADKVIINHTFNIEKTDQKIRFFGELTRSSKSINTDDFLLLKFSSNSNSYYFLTNFSVNAANSIFWGGLNKDDFKPGLYTISLISIHQNSYSVVTTNKTVQI